MYTCAAQPSYTYLAVSMCSNVQHHITHIQSCSRCGRCRGVSSGGLRVFEHPPKVWQNSQLSSCMTTIVTDKQQLVTKTKTSFSSLLGLKQPSLSSSRLQERVNEGCGQHLGAWLKFCTRILRAFGSAPPFRNSWTHPCDGYGK